MLTEMVGLKNIRINLFLSYTKVDQNLIFSVPDFVPLPTEEFGCRADTQIKCPGSTSRICEVISLSVFRILKKVCLSNKTLWLPV